MLDGHLTRIPESIGSQQGKACNPQSDWCRCNPSSQVHDQYNATAPRQSQRADQLYGDAPEENVNCLLKTTLPQRAVLVPVDAVASDGHKVSAAGHAVHQSSQVPVVDIRPIELNHIPDLLHEGFASRFNAQDIQDVDDVVAGRPLVVDIRLTHHLRNTHPDYHSTALRLQQCVGISQTP